MSRRRTALTRTFVAAGVSLVTLLGGCSAEKTTEDARPSVLVISVDTLRSDRLPAYGYGGVKTPAIDALAAEAIRFEHAFSPVPQTLPAHATMFTGTSPLQLNVRDNLGYSLGSGVETLAEVFRRAGYRTGGAVSAWVLRADTGIAQGFEFWDDAADHTPSGQKTIAQRSGDSTRQALIKWLDSISGTQPFFGFLHIYEPHAPWEPSERSEQHPYDAEVERADAIVGRVFEDLRARGRWNDTVIVLVSDHGEGLGDHGEDEHGVLLYREALQVPLLVRIPGSSAGTRSDLASIADLPATIAAAAGVDWDGGGRDLLGSTEPPPYLLAFSDYGRIHLGWAPLRAAIDESSHLITGTFVELFDWKSDPAERVNIAEQRRRDVARLREAVSSADSQSPFRAPSAAIGDEEREKLASLGYLGSAIDHGTSDRDPRTHIGAIRKFRQVSAAVENEEWERAVRLGRELTSEEPSFAQAWGILAQALRGAGHDLEAIDAFRSQLRLSPQNASAALALSELYARRREWAEAVAHAELALSSEGEGARTLLLRIARAAGNRSLLEREVQGAGADDSAGLPRLLAASEGARTLGWPEAELGLLTRAATAMREGDGVPGVHFRIGELLLERRRPLEADQAFASELSINPRHVGAWANRAAIAAARGDREAALQILEAGRSAAGPAMEPAAAEIRALLSRR